MFVILIPILLLLLVIITMVISVAGCIWTGSLPMTDFGHLPTSSYDVIRIIMTMIMMIMVIMVVEDDDDD